MAVTADNLAERLTQARCWVVNFAHAADVQPQHMSDASCPRSLTAAGHTAPAPCVTRLPGLQGSTSAAESCHSSPQQPHCPNDEEPETVLGDKGLAAGCRRWRRLMMLRWTAACRRRLGAPRSGGRRRRCPAL